MKKKILHLICNSHIDPLWQWDWDEGASAALATFYAACNLLDKYDFIFCHNEVLLYEYIEKYDPELFKRIQKLVLEGKWKIMGGWYCQPDCLIPSGESFIRQISLGREYFLNRFNARPTAALNFDSFGHTRGLPQILKKTGYDSYIFCRPLANYVSIPNFKDYPHEPFLWEGYDGSRVKAFRYEDFFNNYSTPLGEAKMSITRKVSFYPNLDIIPVLWGVGNHGGTVSEKDLEDIIVLKDEKKGEWEIIHSTLEDYFASVNPTLVVNRQIFVFLKSYSSCNAIKLAHDQLENALYMGEKVCSISEINGKYIYNKDIFKAAEKTLCQIEFHDVLAGTSVKSGTDSSIRKAYHAIEELKEEMFKAFNAIAKDLPKVPAGDDNNVFLNPHPYDYHDFVECEIYPQVYAKDDENYKIELYDSNNNLVEFQQIKEESNISFPHRIRLLFKANIPALSVTSYRVHTTFVPLEKHIRHHLLNDVVIKDDIKEVVICKKTGLLTSYKVNGVEYLKGQSSIPYKFNDNGDPWGWRLYDLTKSTFSENGWPQKEVKKNIVPFKLDSKSKGIYEGLDSVTILEDGPFLCEIQSIFTSGESHVVVNYKIYKGTPYIDINYHVLWNEKHKGLKIKFPIDGDNQYFAQMAFGREKYLSNGIENPSNRYVGVKKGDKAFAIYNKSGIHSVSKTGKDLYLTLLNGSSWCAHPTTEDKYLVPPERFDPCIEQGIHDFKIRLSVNKIEECERIAKEFNEPVYAVSYFPHGNNKDIASEFSLTNKNIVITAFKALSSGGYLIRLYNGSEIKAETTLKIKTSLINVKFNKFEFKSFKYDGNEIVEVNDASIY